MMLHIPGVLSPEQLTTARNLLKQGRFSSSISATQSPSNLLLLERADQPSIELIKSRLRAFYEMGVALGSSRTVDPLLETMVKHLCHSIPGAQRGALLLRELLVQT